MKKALITGASGFVGRYLALELLDKGYEVWGGTRSVPPQFVNGLKMIELDLTEREEILKKLEEMKPQIIFHLSGQSSVKSSWSEIKDTFESNVMNSIELFEAVKNYSNRDNIRLITIGSSEEYGLGVSLPITEDMITNPINPYGMSKQLLARLAVLYRDLYKMNIIHVRPFNHIGPGQKLGFVTSDFTKQIIDIEQGLVEPVMSVGDLSSKRDFTDVRDIVKAYRLVGEKGLSGSVYNVSSGVSVSINEILNTLLSFSSNNIEVVVDSEKLRPNNIVEYYGSNLKINKDVGWKPMITLKQSLYDIYSYWKFNQDIR